MKITIPVLSLWQPWASAMALHIKENETRHWPTKFRGLVAIHAAKKWDAETRAAYADPCCQRVRDTYGEKPPLGGIVALTIITGCQPTESFQQVWNFAGTREEQLGNYAPGRYAFTTAGTKRVEPMIPLLGRQQPFFPWEIESDDLILAAGVRALQGGMYFACLCCGQTSTYGRALTVHGCPRCVAFHTGPR